MLGATTIGINPDSIRNLDVHPLEQPLRSLYPGSLLSVSLDSVGHTGYGGSKQFQHGDDAEGDESFDQAIFQTAGSDVGFRRPLFGKRYGRGGLRSGVVSLEQFGFNTFEENYTGPVAQAQKLRNNTHFNMMNLRGSRLIASPDPMTQYEIGYTLPLQEFAFIVPKDPFTPAGANNAGSMMAAAHPTLKRPVPTQSIPTAMPWNSAPGTPYNS